MMIDEHMLCREGGADNTPDCTSPDEFGALYAAFSPVATRAATECHCVLMASRRGRHVDQSFLGYDHKL